MESATCQTANQLNRNQRRDPNALVRERPNDSSRPLSWTYGRHDGLDAPPVPLLTAFLTNGSIDVRMQATQLLGEIGGTEAVPALISALEDEAAAVRHHAAEALIGIGQDAYPPLLQKLIEHPESIWLRQGAELIFNSPTAASNSPAIELLVDTLRFTTSHEALAAAARQVMAECGQADSPKPRTTTDTVLSTASTEDRTVQPRLLTPLRNLVAMAFSHGTSFDHAWRTLSKQRPASSDALTGLWTGRWTSDVTGQTGKIECVTERTDDTHCTARFRMTRWRLIHCGYQVTLTAHRAHGQWMVQGPTHQGNDQTGLYRFRGTISPQAFRCRYESSHDYGTLELNRYPNPPGPANQPKEIASS